MLIAWLAVGMPPLTGLAGDRIHEWGLAQKTVNTPQRDATGAESRRQPEPAKVSEGQGHEPKTADGAQAEPPKPFEPSEKVKADQALDFPADM